MQTITAYMAKDGTKFFDVERCLQYERDLDEAERILRRVMLKPPTTKSNGETFRQHHHGTRAHFAE